MLAGLRAVGVASGPDLPGENRPFPGQDFLIQLLGRDLGAISHGERGVEVERVSQGGRTRHLLALRLGHEVQIEAAAANCQGAAHRSLGSRQVSRRIIETRELMIHFGRMSVLFAMPVDGDFHRLFHLLLGFRRQAASGVCLGQVGQGSRAAAVAANFQ